MFEERFAIWWPVARIAACSMIAYVFGLTIYRLYFHPLAKFPGPKLAAVSGVWVVWSWMSGSYPFIMEEAHKKYGDIVRIAPNELSFATSSSLKTLYAHKSKSHSSFLKGPWYDLNPSIEPAITSVRDPTAHSEQRRSLSHGFSSSSLREQSSLIYSYEELFVRQLKRHATHEPIVINEWYNWFTFDVIGDLTFAESFGALEEARPNFWIDLMVNQSYVTTLHSAFNRYPLLRLLAPLLIPKNAIEMQRKGYEQVQQKLTRRMNNQSERNDFLKDLLKKGRPDPRLLLQQSNTLIVAGSETTATGLTGITYHLLKYPETLRKLQDEVRGAFKSSEEIVVEKADQLPYLHAVCEEGLRLFPPVAFGLQRVVPAEGVAIDGHFIPGRTLVSTDPWAVTRTGKYWHKPHEFVPERWLPDCPHEFAQDDKDASKPFSIGPRACLGINLAYLELKTMLAKLVWNFDWVWGNPDLDWTGSLSTYLLWKKPPVMIKFVERV